MDFTLEVIDASAIEFKDLVLKKCLVQKEGSAGHSMAYVLNQNA